MTEMEFGRKSSPRRVPLVKAENIIKLYGDNIVLDQVDLEIFEGDVVALIGPSGSGKTTLLRTLDMLEVPTSGSVTFEGVDITDVRVNLSDVRRRMGIVFQSYNLFPHRTAQGNIMLALQKVSGLSRDAAASRALEELERVGLREMADRFPGQLSGGQQQRVAIARALALDPSLMLFDEVTSALDPELVREVLETMRTLASNGMTMLVVTHEMEFARTVSDWVVFMQDGKIVEVGHPDQIFDSPKTSECRRFVTRVR